MVVFEFDNSFFYPVCVIAVLVQLGGVITHAKPEARRQGARWAASERQEAAGAVQPWKMWSSSAAPFPPGWLPLCALPGATANFLASLSIPTVKSLSTYPIPAVGTNDHFLLIKAPSSSRALVPPPPWCLCWQVRSSFDLYFADD